jgi:glyoxylase-like metal-dependent hydrolase (beta-lactamase superfamily II)
LDGGAMFGNAPKALWQRWLPPDAENRIELACRCLLIECEGQKILCETGIGAFFEPKMAERYGIQTPERHRLLENLAALGIKEAEIDMVILSHLHFDHAGGLLSPFSTSPTRLLFPKATYVLGTESLARAQQPHLRDRASFIPELVPLLLDSGRLLQIDHSDAQGKIPGPLQDRISFYFTHGHTPGHMHTFLRGDTHSVFFCGDLIPGLSWLHLPITMGYDRFPEKLIDEKKKIYAPACQENWYLFYTHDSRVAMSQCKQDEKGRMLSLNEIEAPLRWAL